MKHVTADQVDEWASWVEDYAELHRQLAQEEEDPDTVALRESDAKDADRIAKHLRNMDVGKAMEEVRHLDSAIRDTYYEDMEGFSDATERVLAAQAQETEAQARDGATARSSELLHKVNRYRRSIGHTRDLQPGEWSDTDLEELLANAPKRFHNPETLKRRLLR